MDKIGRSGGFLQYCKFARNKLKIVPFFLSFQSWISELFWARKWEWRIFPWISVKPGSSLAASSSANSGSVTNSGKSAHSSLENPIIVEEDASNRASTRFFSYFFFIKKFQVSTTISPFHLTNVENVYSFLFIESLKYSCGLAYACVCPHYLCCTDILT